jgi:hypothetical protein
MLAISARTTLLAKKDIPAARPAAKHTVRFKVLPHSGDAAPNRQIKKGTAAETNGHATAPPRAEMKSRRLMRRPHPQVVKV